MEQGEKGWAAVGVPIAPCKMSLFFLTPAAMAHLYGNSVKFLILSIVLYSMEVKEEKGTQ